MATSANTSARLSAFNKAVQRALKDDDGTQRTGQRMFNILHEMEPEIADDIRGTADDPFYDNGRIPEFMAVVCWSLR